MARYPRCETSGKMRFPDFGTAASSALTTSRARGIGLRPYQCPDCGDYHLTKSAGNPRVATVPGPFTPADLARLLARKTTA